MPAAALTMLIPCRTLTGRGGRVGWSPARVGMQASLLWVIAGLLLALSAAAAQPLPARELALRQLEHADAAVRRAAAARLAEVGRMPDVPALVKALRDRDGAARDAAERAIWNVWGRSGDDAIDDLYQRGIAQMSVGGVEDAIATFTRIIRAKPDFAEGWNKRATLYYMAGALDKSLLDCDEVMKRNPLHFGALSGYG